MRLDRTGLYVPGKWIGLNVRMGDSMSDIYIGLKELSELFLCQGGIINFWKSVCGSMII